ncbi:hypothetical protein [Fibrobacter sp. UWEL]|uniref:hypothetical protein n=1 Tax=Fibrobacter sp. UWEL TaxID=1896209 RepID=UPI00091AFBE5|nr:hypothetical protein [Fibrobacter sp. UWEL]SHL32274.1 hypothetical protein SAMN05720468_1228 [Fibrobacter sp. UWEL]
MAPNINGMFYCEHLSSDEHTLQQITLFKVKHPDAKNLELFLQNHAAAEETNNKNRTYLIKDRKTNEIVCYFSLRNGLFTIPNDYSQSFSTVPAIELSNFAVNESYKQQYPKVHQLGAMTLRNFILPIVKQIQEQSGVQALYIYALPNDKLIEHYSSLGFMRFDPEEEAFIHNHVKPLYDKGCVFMCQGV